MNNSAIVIGSVTILVALASLFFRPRDTQWVKRLNRPQWLVFEPVIPIIWTVIFICGAVLAILIWETDPGSYKTWLLMGFYLLLEIVTVAYIPTTLRLRSLKIGTALGSSGAILGIFLTLAVLPVSRLASALLLPYVLWSPIGTYITWEMILLNPDAA